MVVRGSCIRIISLQLGDESYNLSWVEIFICVCVFLNFVRIWIDTLYVSGFYDILQTLGEKDSSMSYDFFLGICNWSKKKFWVLIFTLPISLDHEITKDDYRSFCEKTASKYYSCGSRIKVFLKIKALGMKLCCIMECL